jgi:predicted nucleotidyltransferase
MMIQPLLQSNLSELQKIFRSHKVKKAYAFGSICTPRFNENSDIDFLISFEENMDPLEEGENHLRLFDLVETLFKRPVDLIVEKSVKNPYFIKVMNKTRTAIYD